MSDYIPSVVQVIPHEDYTIDVYFDDGKIVCYNAKTDMSPKLFERICSKDIFLDRCTVLNGTLAWDVAGGRNKSACIDIDPFVLYELKRSEEGIA